MILKKIRAKSIEKCKKIKTMVLDVDPKGFKVNSCSFPMYIFGYHAIFG